MDYRVHSTSSVSASDCVDPASMPRLGNERDELLDLPLVEHVNDRKHLDRCSPAAPPLAHKLVSVCRAGGFCRWSRYRLIRHPTLVSVDRFRSQASRLPAARTARAPDGGSSIRGCSVVAPRNDQGRSDGVTDVLPAGVGAGQSVLACRDKIDNPIPNISAN
jgi:hypothetical protein